MAAVHSNLLADVSGASTADNATVVQWAATGGNNQKWQAVDAGGGNVYLRAVHSGKCLAPSGGSTADGAAMVQLTCNNQNSQKWQAVTTTTAGVYQLTVRPQRKVPGRQRRLDLQRRRASSNGPATATTISAGV